MCLVILEEMWSGLRCCQTWMNNPCVIAVGRRKVGSRHRTTDSANSGESEGLFTQRRSGPVQCNAVSLPATAARLFNVSSRLVPASFLLLFLYSPASSNLQVVLGHQSVINVSAHQDYLIAIALQYGCSTFYSIAGGA
jgi:hypothetical protein